MADEPSTCISHSTYNDSPPVGSPLRQAECFGAMAANIKAESTRLLAMAAEVPSDFDRMCLFEVVDHLIQANSFLGHLADELRRDKREG
jgi:hypothetical protein